MYICKYMKWNGTRHECKYKNAYNKALAKCYVTATLKCPKDVKCNKHGTPICFIIKECS